MTKLPNGFYSYSDGYLKSMNKQGLINYIRTIEKNWENALITNEIQYKNCKKLLSEEHNKTIDEFVERIDQYCSMSEMNRKMIQQISEEMRGTKNE